MIVTVTLNPAIDRTIDVPGFRVGQLARGRAVGCMAAGKGVNVSRVLAALGRESVVTGFVGHSEKHLYGESLPGTVKNDFVPVQGSTRCNTTILDPEDGTETHIREEGFGITDGDREQLTRRLDALLASEDFVAFCGSLPRGVEAAHLAEWVARYGRAGCRVFVDTSGSALVEAVNAQPYAIKPNVAEIAELARSLGNRVGAGTDALWESVEVILLSLGEHGGAHLSRDEAWAAHVPDLPEPAVNTVGCGDAFLAGCLFAAANGQSPGEQIETAVACGSASALTPFAGSIESGHFEHLRERVRARKETVESVLRPDAPWFAGAPAGPS